MALTSFQRELCRLLAAHRRESGESYVAGGMALNELICGPRVSRDLDLFHDTEEALRVSCSRDRTLLEQRGFRVEVLRDFPSFVESLVARRSDERLLVQWTRDSAYRFFPLIENEEFGLVLHPLDLATNKVLALVGRLEPRDWIDVLESNDRLQPLGYLLWAACGKDPGFGPSAILSEARRTSRYSQVELDELSFEGSPPDAADLGRRWHEMLASAARIVELLPGAEVGKAVLTAAGTLYRGGFEQLLEDLTTGGVVFHGGRIRGAWPVVSQP